ncbi:hypothetical protein RhiirC2_761551 [Rhizophagus irregularis]|uniref:Uncharacterized protein n=1 Tax=Rhizophagus irregularis TaxID=588596 RepID=A0A2N1MGC2_9GLOM|nr:hypothetical protein RhiirC2_761551 [Rhizophagus irregularis]
MPAVNINRKYFISMVSESVVQEDRKSYLNHFVEEIFQRKVRVITLVNRLWCRYDNSIVMGKSIFIKIS